MSGPPYIIKLSTTAPYLAPAFPLLRQTPGGNGVWKDFQFVWNERVERCHAWFVYDGLSAPEHTQCPPGNVGLIAAEPSAYKTYRPNFLKQFDHVITCQRKSSHPSARVAQPALPWFVNQSHDTLSRNQYPSKTKTMSIICSRKRNMKWHRVRLKFLERLRAQFGDRIDLFGRGLRELPDKWDGLQPYRYSIALENSIEDHYWTEKLSDCFLAGTVLIYSGAPNLADYFPEDAFVPIDIREGGNAMRVIESLLERDDYEMRRGALDRARDRVLNEFNLFNVMSEFSRGFDLDAPPVLRRVVPESAPGKIRKPLEKFKRAYLGRSWIPPWH